MQMLAANFPAAAQTTQGIITGGDAGEGLDLQGDIVLAYHMGGDASIYEVGEALFKPDSGLRLTGADGIIDNWAAPDFGPTFHDGNLALVMQSIRHNGQERGTMTLTQSRSMVTGDTYKVQLLFIESGPSLRRFDIAVSGVTVLPAFTLLAATDPPVARVVTHTFVATDRNFVITLDGASIPDEAGVDTNPILSALTLEHCPPFTVVVANSNGSGPGSLRQAIADASGCPAMITFAPALNNQFINVSNGQLEITGTGPTIIDASALPAGITISGNNASRVLRTGPGAHVRLINLRLVDGSGLPSTGVLKNGGALLNEGTVILDRCTLAENAVSNTTRGGGLYNMGTATLTNCTIADNPNNLDNANSGGGIFNDAAGHLTLTGCTVSNNRASSGGGLENHGTAVLTGCTFFANGSYTFGGGVANHGAAVFTLCTFADNVAENSGAAVSNDGAATLIACTFSGNSVSYSRGGPRGGGIAHASVSPLSALTLDHCLIAGNTATDMGIGPDVFAASPVTASWCLIGDGNNSGIFPSPTNGNKVGGGSLPVIPARLGPLGSNGGLTLTALPLPGSGAIDAGNPAVIPPPGSTDQRGGKRRRGASQDIGAVETVPDFSSVRLTLFPPSGGTQNLQVLFPVNVGPVFTQTSTNLSSWTPIVPAETGAPGLFSVPFNPGEKKRFYRLAEPP